MKKKESCKTPCFIKLALAFLIMSIVIVPSIDLSSALSSPTVTLDPPSFIAHQVNEVFQVDIKISNVEHLWGYTLNLTWNPEFITLAENPVDGGFLSQHFTNTFLVDPPGKTTGTGVSMPLDTCGITDVIFGLATDYVDGDGILSTVKFKVLKPCSNTEIRISGMFLISGVKEGYSVPGAPGDETYDYLTPTTTSISTTISLPSADGAPIASAGKNQTVTQGTLVILNASQSFSSSDNPTYTWTFTDRTVQTLDGIIANYTFNNVGVYNIALTVEDSYGTDTANTTVTVKAAPPSSAPDNTGNPDPSGSSDATSTPQSTSNQVSSGLGLPPTVLGILVTVTVFVIVGSVFWLRKNG
jgi:hypothetical protein